MPPKPMNVSQWTSDGANTSAVQWPTLQEAMKLRRIGVDESSSSMKDGDEFKFWDGVTDWFM
jgi:hypothetical protein